MDIKVLIIRFSSIGDIVLTSPVVRCLKQQIDDIEVHYLTKKSFESILFKNPHIDQIHCLEENISELIPKLRAEDFNYIIDLHNNLRSAIVKFKLGKFSYSFNKLNLQKWLLVNFKVNLLPDVHIVDRYFKTVKFLGVENDDKGLDYFIPESDEVDLSTLPSIYQSGYIGFVIGGKHSTKCLPTSKIISICKKIDKPIVLLGDNSDGERAEEIRKSVGDKIYNACGKYNINGSASLVRQAEKIVTHDTGLMHIAAAFNKDIISIWGNTVPEFGMYPYLPGRQERSKIFEVKELFCRPCSKIGYAKCPKGHFKCMNLISEEQIVEAVKR